MCVWNKVHSSLSKQYACQNASAESISTARKRWHYPVFRSSSSSMYGMSRSSKLPFWELVICVFLLGEVPSSLGKKHMDWATSVLCCGLNSSLFFKLIILLTLCARSGGLGGHSGLCVCNLCLIFAGNGKEKRWHSFEFQFLWVLIQSLEEGDGTLPLYWPSESRLSRSSRLSELIDDDESRLSSEFSCSSSGNLQAKSTLRRTSCHFYNQYYILFYTIRQNNLLERSKQKSFSRTSLALWTWSCLSGSFLFHLNVFV